MKQNETNLVQKSSNNYICVCCHYNTSRLSQFQRHVTTDKHKNRTNETNATKMKQESTEKFQCLCGIVFGSRTTLWRHKKVCNSEDMINKTKDNKTDDMTDKELIALLIKEHTKLVEQNSEMLEIIKNGTHYTTNTNCNNNSNNKTFNLQFFLNETCKDAMNIMDFVDSIKIQLTDLIKVGEIGYVEGISNIITTNLTFRIIRLP